uniref:Uncharacterized protein n=1 Tax=Lepeophtheirus salmonis TaxID=72036 RepID=A0A0K2TPC2_LEPSM
MMMSLSHIYDNHGRITPKIGSRAEKIYSPSYNIKYIFSAHHDLEYHWAAAQVSPYIKATLTTTYLIKDAFLSELGVFLRSRRRRDGIYKFLRLLYPFILVVYRIPKMMGFF